jgi:hypothetical protein
MSVGVHEGLGVILKVDKILRIKSSGSFFNLSDNLSDLLTGILRLSPCLPDLDFPICLKLRVQRFPAGQIGLPGGF